MKNNLYIICLFAFALLLGCSRKEPDGPDRECLVSIDTFSFTFGIDYTDTITCLVPGEQSDLEEKYLEEVKMALGIPDNNIDYIVEFCHWMNQNFIFEIAGGAMAGKVDVNDLFEIRTLYGCHSAALIVSGVLRKLGFPAVMIETFDVQWAYDYHDGKVEYFAGHVMSEVYAEHTWILLDNNGMYVEDYNPLDPFIPVSGHPTDAYFVFAKGLDTWDYSGKDEYFTDDNLLFYSDNIYCFEEMFNTVQYTWSN